MVKVDLNCDLGESFGAWTMGRDADVIPFISSANIACGYHASDPLVMARTVALAHKAGVGIGAHPGFPDLMGFGRRNMAVTPAEAEAYILYQLGALAAFCKAEGTPLAHVKPHGALYNMAAVDKALAEAICNAVAKFDDRLIVLALSGSEMVEAAKRKGLKAASEVFADRAYEDDGTLRSRKLPRAMIDDEDEAVARVLRMVTEGKVVSANGKDVAIQADSVCVHGDDTKALIFVRKIRAALEAAGVRVEGFSPL
jgi:UPF0271 protein